MTEFDPERNSDHANKCVSKIIQPAPEAASYRSSRPVGRGPGTATIFYPLKVALYKVLRHGVLPLGQRDAATWTMVNYANGQHHNGRFRGVPEMPNKRTSYCPWRETA